MSQKSKSIKNLSIKTSETHTHTLLAFAKLLGRVFFLITEGDFSNI